MHVHYQFNNDTYRIIKCKNINVFTVLEALKGKTFVFDRFIGQSKTAFMYVKLSLFAERKLRYQRMLTKFTFSISI